MTVTRTDADSTADATARPTEVGLARLLGRALDRPAEVDGLERLTGGSSREIWAFRADGRDLVLRRDPPGESRPEGARLERAVISAARNAGVTVPEVLALAEPDDPDLPGGGLVMDRVVGESVPRRVLSAPELATARSGLGERCGRELGRLHALDPTMVPGLPTEDRLSSYRRQLDDLDELRPVLELAHQWLLQRRPAQRGEVVVHGDFRLGNLVVDPDGLVAVLDWESAHRGDPLEDLGWVAVKAWRFRGPGTIGGFGEVEPFLAAYADARGTGVSREDFDWGVVLGTWIWAVGCLVQANRHLSGRTRSVDLAVVGRRVVEVERDLLELLA